MYFCFGTLNYFNYINVMINYPRFMFFNDEWNKKILKQIRLSRQEWNDALRIPTPIKNKKKYNRKNKHKNKGYE